MDERFGYAIRLVEILGETKLPNGRSFRDELRLGQEVSFWDVVASNMALYRFPLLFSRDAGCRSASDRMKYRLRPYLGLAARVRDSAKANQKKNRSACSMWPRSKNTVLFLGFVPNFYRDVLRPVAESLASGDNMQAVVIGEGRNNKETSPRGEGIVFHSIWEHWDAGTEKCSKNMAVRLDSLQDAFFHSPRFIEIEEWMGGKLGTSALTRELKWLFWRELVRLIPHMAVARHVLDVHRPAIVISADDADQRCRVYSLSAGERGIPALLVQQGLTSKEYPEWRFFSHAAVAATGQTSLSDMEYQGVPSEKIVLTGSPGFDHLAREEQERSSEIRKLLGVSGNQKMVLFASQPYYVGVFDTPEIRKEMIKALVNVCGSRGYVKLIVKPHPGDNFRELNRLIGNPGPATIVDRSIDISPLIKACDILTTFFSTTALQAIYAGKPVINLAFPNSGGLDLYTESGCTWVARSMEELEKHVENLSGKNRDKEIASRFAARQLFLTEMIHCPDGKAASRVHRVVLDLLQRHRFRNDSISPY